jgi:hypothetical protein
VSQRNIALPSNTSPIVWGSEIKEGKKGGECSTHGKSEIFSIETGGGRDCLGNLHVEYKIILNRPSR